MISNTGILEGVKKLTARFRQVVIEGGTPGAPLSMRIVGSTTSGAPTVGTWKAGDFVTDRAGLTWICTVNGTPGTWVQSGGGGFSNPMTTLGDIIYENATPAAARLAGQTTATKNFLTQTGNGSISAAPAWGTIAAGDVPTLNQNTTGSAGSITVLTTLGDILYENSTPANARLAGNTTSTKNFLTQTGTGSVSAAPAWGTIASADMPTGTTSAKGALQLDGTASDIQNTGVQAAGTSGLAADAKHVHFSSGMYLCAPNVYAPASRTALTVTTTTMAAWSTGNVCTNSFTAPASGHVVVTFFGVVMSSVNGDNIGFGLAAKGTVTPLVANVATIGAPSYLAPYTIVFDVTGLTAGNSYQFDLLGCATSTTTGTLEVQGQTSTALAAAATPAVMTVQAV